MRERILAVLGAAALIAVAFVVRSALTDDDEGGGGGGGGGRPVVACTADLMAVCDALVAERRIAADPPTLDLGDDAMADDEIDGWITWDPAPAIAEFDHPGAWGSTRPIGSSRLAVATRGSQPDLGSGCTYAALEWRCLDVAARDGLAVGVGPGTTAQSLARLYPLAASLVPDDGDFTDLTTTQVDAILSSPVDRQAAMAAQLTTLRTKPGALVFVVGTEMAFESASGVQTVATAPATEAVVVLAERDDGADLLDGSVASGAVEAALRDAGVTPGGGRLAPQERAGELYALRGKVG